MNNEKKSLPSSNNIHDIFNHFFENPFPSFFYQSFRVDIYDVGSKIVVEAELPGFEQNQIKIEAIHEGLKIIAEDKRELETIDESIKYFKKERNVHRVERIISLPYEVSTANTKAHYKNGILEIHIPKDSRKKQRYINIE
ncbi:Hsp20/alpha crystallin family protein [Calidifontibacillus oryziterrae]|uniref:Hsp20/alpha crystallin family protein n=1 Tax=Calidifontibacillus oryziterrae TaxID=1191699 RepID=UPI00030A91BD|nr:Hsp20/alpha crystallin family protein [Calidifontibacillus oryziterrae]